MTKDPPRPPTERTASAGPLVSERARDAGGDRSVLSRFLAGQRTITTDTVDRMAPALELRLIPER